MKFEKSGITSKLIGLIRYILGRGRSALPSRLWPENTFHSLWKSSKVRIKCVNENCTAPGRIFEFEEKNLGTSGPAKPNDLDAREFVVKCPFCGTMNSIWLKMRPSSVSYGMGVTIVKDTPLDFK